MPAMRNWERKWNGESLVPPEPGCLLENDSLPNYVSSLFVNYLAILGSLVMIQLVQEVCCACVFWGAHRSMAGCIHCFSSATVGCLSPVHHVCLKWPSHLYKCFAMTPHWKSQFVMVTQSSMSCEAQFAQPRTRLLPGPTFADFRPNTHTLWFNSDI